MGVLDLVVVLTVIRSRLLVSPSRRSLTFEDFTDSKETQLFVLHKTKNCLDHEFYL